MRSSCASSFVPALQSRAEVDEVLFAGGVDIGAISVPPGCLRLESLDLHACEPPLPTNLLGRDQPLGRTPAYSAAGQAQPRGHMVNTKWRYSAEGLLILTKRARIHPNPQA